MSKLEDDLAALEPRTKIAKIKKIMPLINQKLDDGCAYADILTILNKNGFDITEGVLKTYVYRFRKQTKNQPAAITENPAIKSSAVKNNITEKMEANTENNTETNAEKNQPAPTKKLSDEELDNLFKVSAKDVRKYS